MSRKFIPAANHLDPERHKRCCRICSHPQKDEIEQDYLDWKSPEKIVAEYKLGNRASVYRHAGALNLTEKRERNLRGPLGKIIEKVDDVNVNASAVIQAVALLARINSQGELVELGKRVFVQEILDSMSPTELEAYAKDGTLPEKLRATLGATPIDVAARKKDV